MKPNQHIDRIIASGEKLFDAQVARSNHLALPVGVLLRFRKTHIFISVDTNEDSIAVTTINDDTFPENLEPDSQLNPLIGCRLKTFGLIPNKRGYVDVAMLEFLTDSGEVLQIRLVAGASQLELISS